MKRWQVLQNRLLQALGWLKGAAQASQIVPFPLIGMIKGYRWATFNLDFRAGLNGALLGFPQGMAYAMIANLPVAFGIYGAAVGAIVGASFSGLRFSTFGPTNATAILLLSSYLTIRGQADPIASLSLFLLMVGSILLIGALTGIGSLIRFVSRTVVTGYITAAALLIILHQIQNVLGFRAPDDGSAIGLFFSTLQHLNLTHPPTLVLSILTACTFVILAQKAPMLPTVAVTLAITSLFGFMMHRAGVPLAFLSTAGVGTWELTLPTVTLNWIQVLASGAAAMAFLIMVETSSIAKSLASRSGERVNVNQELYALGLANCACAFFGGMPASGSLTRSSLNLNSGAATPVAAIVSGALCGLGILLLGPLISWIPRATLAVSVIMIGLTLINRRNIRVAVGATSSDALVFYITFVSGLFFPLYFAIFLGVATSIILFLRKASSPMLVEYSFKPDGQLFQLEDIRDRPSPNISIVHVEGDLFFGASELFQEQIRRVCTDPRLKIVILRLRNAYHLDATSVMELEELIRYLRETDRHLIISGARRDVFKVVKDSGLLEVMGRENFFVTSAQNPNLSTRNALKRAQELLGGEKAEVSIYYDPQQSETKKPS